MAESEDRDGFLDGFFRAGEVREVLGMRLVCDTERAKRTFPEHNRRSLARIFVEEPGTLAESIGFTDLAAGDALWKFRDDVARFRGMGIGSTAALVTGIVERHHPCARTGLCFVLGSNRSGRPPHGWTACRSIMLPDSLVGDLRALAGELRAHAAKRKLLISRARGHHERGPYLLHVLLRRFGRRRFVHDGRKMTPVVDLPVHEQYRWLLAFELGRIAPCDIVIAAEGGRVRFESLGGDGGRKARDIANAMAPYHFGSARWLIRALRTWAQSSARRPIPLELEAGSINLRVRILPRWRARVTMTAAAQDGASQSCLGRCECSTASQ